MNVNKKNYLFQGRNFVDIFDFFDFPKCAPLRFWSGCGNAQCDLNLCWAHMSEITFADVAAQI